MMNREENEIKRKRKSRSKANQTVATSNETPLLYVGIGASAGGLEAIEAFFSSMPRNNGMAFIVVQHLSPDYKSLMVELLSKRTQMKVNRAEDGVQVLPNSIYMIPPQKNLTIFHGKLMLSDQRIHSKEIRLPIDIFLRSLADDQGEKAVAVILSGTGSDGTQGVRAIKESGGMIMVQDEESAKFDGMPRNAIATGLCDFILPPSEMPRQLLNFLEHPYISKAKVGDNLLTDEDSLNRIFFLLREKMKLDFTHYKMSTKVRRIERRMSVCQIFELRDYVKYLETFPNEVTTLYREMLIGVTGFFRNPEAFEIVANECLAQLFENCQSNEIRIWIPGCSTGEEAYTFAILCREQMRRLDKQISVKIFATDVDHDAVQEAGNGVYPGSIAADIPSELLTRYFIPGEDSFQVTRGIREMVVFARHNLIKDPPFPNIDMVSCRNLLIYLQPILQRKVLEFFNFSINPKGFLLLGNSETTGEMSDYFEPVNHKWKIYRSRGKRRYVGVGNEVATPPSFNTDLRINRPTFRSHRGVAGEHSEERVLKRLMQCIAGDYLPLTLVVNDQMELVHAIGDTEGYLKVPSGKMINDITKMAAKDLAIPLATGIQKALKKREEIKYSNIMLKHMESSRILSMRLKALPAKKTQEQLVAVFLEETVKDDRNTLASDLHSYDVGKGAAQRIQDLEQELQFTKENLQATIEELETSNEELQATNEELLASNEELQSTNEELQSVNEELFTVNAEFQRKIMELTELNNDVDNLMESTRILTLFLDENLDVRKFTPSVSDIFKIIDSDVGRPFSHLSHTLENCDPASIAQNVHETSRSQVMEVQAKGKKWYLMRVLPYSVSPGTFSGVVLTFIDITTFKETQHAYKKSEERYDLVQNTAGIGNWDWNIITGELYWSKHIVSMFGFVESEFEGTYEAFLQCVHPDDRQRVKDAVDAAVNDNKEYNIEHRILWPDGTVRWISEKGEVYHDMNGCPIRMLGVAQDITQRKSISSALRDVNEKYRLLFHNSLIGVAFHKIITNEQGEPVDYVFLDVNETFSRLTGLEKNRVIGKRITEVIPGMEKSEFNWIKIYGKVALEGESIEFEQYSEQLKRHFLVSAYCPVPGHFVTVFNEVIKNAGDKKKGGLVSKPKSKKTSAVKANPNQER